MKELKRDLKSVMKGLKALLQETEKIAKKVDKIGKAKVAKKPKPKPRVKPAKKRVAKKATKVTAIDAVLSVVKKSKKGVDTAILKKKTGFVERKIWDVVNRLKKQGKIKSKGKGVYVKA